MANHAFADLVGDEQVFFTEYFNKKPMLRKNAVPGDPRDILSLRKLDQLVNLEVIRPPYIKVNLKGDGVPEQGYSRNVVVQGQTITDTVDPEKIYELYRAGATVTWCSLNHIVPEMRDFTRVISEKMAVRTDTVAFLTPSAKKGYPPHHDPVDLFIVQLEGSKHWKLWNPPTPRLGNNAQYTLEGLGEPEIEVSLQPGDVLYLPYGTPHAATAEGSGSLHLSIMMRPRMWRDLLRELVAPHDRVLVESPGHPHLLRAVEAAGARPVPVPLGDAGWDLAAWARALRETAPRLACVTADFQQPTGLLMAEESRRALVALAAATGTTLLVDETLAELSLTRPGRVPLPCAAFDPGGTVVTVGSVAKSLWAGLRVGWIRATPWLVRALVARRTGADLAPPVLEQLVAHRLLGDAGTFADVLALQRERGRARRDVLVAALRRELPGWTFRTPDGGLALWAHAGGRSGHELAAVAQRHGVRLAAGSRFGQDTRLDGFLRLPHTQPPEIIEEAVRRIAPHGRGPL
ncbi:aminotransferase class I/II-fold pyridoxal phosphate-dependent enzyme [Streptomyces sp. NPDC101175]|uniref:aminotransferase class I/II-fold pyridoxal phosphate-dependent enzyme n=1 Tax=Streptomyces sp. NPDC101175 TaxID=3366123 RepID=UPI0038384E0B